jgi:hypothetical protein
MRTTCPRCQQPLYFDGAVGFLQVPLVLIALLVGYESGEISSILFGSRGIGWMALSIAIVVAPIHLALAEYLRRRGRLRAFPPTIQPTRL